MAINVKTMLNADELAGNVVIDKNGYAYYDESDPTTKLSKNKITGIYSEQDLGKIVDAKGTRIKGNDAIFKLTSEGSLNEHTITVRDYFKNNGKSSFVNVAQVEKNEVKDSLNIINDGLLDNKNLYNYYNLAENHDGNITKSTIQGTVFNDSVDLSGFKSDQLKVKNKALKSITIKTGKGNDTITGSIINDNITGGAGENTLKFTDYSSKTVANSAYGDDIYNLTSGETLNLEYAGTGREKNLSYAKVGNDIVITDTVTNSVEYTRTKIDCDTVAIRYLKEDVKYDTEAIEYTKVVVTGDTEATKYTKVEVVANSTAEGEGEHQGKYKKVTKTYTRNDGNEGWSDQSEDVIEYVDEAVTASTKYVKNVNGTESTSQDREFDSYVDEGKFNQTTTTYKRNDGNDGWNAEGTATSELVDSAVTASTKYVEKIDGGALSRQQDGEFESYNYEGLYREITVSYERTDNNAGWKNVALQTETRYLEESEVTGKKAHTEYNKYVNGAGTATETKDTDFTSYDDEGKFNQTTTTYTVKEDEGTYSWEQESETTVSVDEAVTASDTVSRRENGATTTVATGDKAETYLEYPPADIDGSIEAEVGSLTLKNLGKNNDLADVEIDGSNLFDTSSDRVFVIDGTKGGTIQGTRGNDEITLGRKNATLSAVVGKDVVYAGTGAVTFNLADQAQNLIDGYEINETTASEADVVVVSDGKNEISVYNADSMKSATVVDSKKVKYNVELMSDSADLSSTKGNNIIFSESKNGMKLNTGSGNDVVIMNDSPNTDLDVVTENLTQELQDEGFKVVESDTTHIQRAITGDDLVEVKAGNIKCAYADGKLSRDVVADDLKDSGLAFVDESHVSKQLTDSDITLVEGESYKVKDGKGYIVKEDAEDRLVTKDDVKAGVLITVDDNGLVDCRETTSGDLNTIPDFTYADGKYSRVVADTDLKSEVSSNFDFVDSSTIKRTAKITSDDLVLTDLQTYSEGKITTSYLNEITYTGGNDAYRGSKTNEVYNINSMNNKTIVTINDLGGSDVLDFTNATLKDMTIFFDYDKTNEMTDVTDLKFISDSSIKANKLTSGYVEVKNYFDGKKEGGAGLGNIETVKTSTSDASVTVGMVEKINTIKSAVAQWFDNNGNYDSASEVIAAGNKADIQSLMQCYSAGTVA